jgi:biotin carboxyl carrier protein
MEEKDKKKSKVKSVKDKKLKMNYSKLDTLIVDETEYKTTLHSKYVNRSPYQKPDPKKIMSVIPGTIVKILVETGQQIEPGEPIVILEAMKMMNKIILPQGGVVRKFNVIKGQVIPKKFLIAELE